MHNNLTKHLETKVSVTSETLRVDVVVHNVMYSLCVFLSVGQQSFLQVHSMGVFSA